MLYNTTEEKLIHKEYGRLVQKMVQKALLMEDANKRQQLAERIITTMQLRFPKAKCSDNLYSKLWNHLANLADYKLDIHYPVEIYHTDKTKKPAKLEYPQHKVRFRHYGYLIEQAFEKISLIQEKEQQTYYLSLIESRMRRITPFKKNNSSLNEIITNDVATYMEHSKKQ